MTKLELTPEETITLYSFLSATLATIKQQDLEGFSIPYSIDLLTSVAYKVAVEMDQQIKNN
jgi:hypothetical protein